MRLAIVAATIGISLAMTGRASGGFMDGNELYAHCTSPSQDRHSLCIGYVAGVMDAGEAEKAEAGRRNRSREAAVIGYCWVVPLDTPSPQAADVVAKFLRDNPARRNIQAANLVAWAMSEAWPCSR